MVKATKKVSKSKLPKLEFYDVSKSSVTISFERMGSSSLKNVSELTSMVDLNGGHLATEKKGNLVWISKDFSKSKVLINLRDIDENFSTKDLEEGLLCCALDGYGVYVSYTRSSEEFPKGTELVVANIGHLEDFKIARALGPISPDLLNPIIAIPFRNTYHHGGTFIFHNSKIYLGTGDGGPQGDRFMASQDPKSLWGKIIEIDPFGKTKRNDVGVPIKVIATGLRNPWRFSIENVRGKTIAFIGDVGYNTVEKVCTIDLDSEDVKNFGWSYFEGSLRFKDGPDFKAFDPPIFEYPTKFAGPDAPSAIVGGYLLDDYSYVFGDYGGYVRVIRNNGKLWSQIGIEKLDDQIYSMAKSGDKIYALCKGGIYRIDVR